MLKSGVPQGGVLSTLVFIIFVADFQLWLKWAWAIVYANDTNTSVAGRSVEDVLEKLEHDALNVLRFMSSNQLVANPAKTNLLLFNHNGDLKSAKLGDEIVEESKCAKLLGIKLEPDLKWKKQITGKDSLTSALN